MRDVKYNNVCRRDIPSTHAAPRCRWVRRNFSLFSLPPPSLAPKFPLNDGRGREVASSSETILLDCTYIVNYLCARRLFRARAKSRPFRAYVSVLEISSQVYSELLECVAISIILLSFSLSISYNSFVHTINLVSQRFEIHFLISANSISSKFISFFRASCYTFVTIFIESGI